MNVSLELKFKFQETGAGPFRRLVWWGGTGALAAKSFTLGISREGHLQFEAFYPTLPSVPGTLLGVRPSTGVLRAVRVHGDYAFVNSDGNGLTVIDISNEMALRLAGTLNVAMNCTNLAISADGTMAVLTGSREYFDGAGALAITNCLYVVDISVPTSPVLLGVLEAASVLFLAVALSGSHAFVACGTAGVKVVDLSNPSAPQDIQTYPASNAKGVTVSGNYAYVANRESGLLILNITNPAVPTLAGNYDTPGDAADVFVSGGLAYIADGNSVQIVNVSTPTAPVPVPGGSFAPPASQVLVANNVAYVAAGTTGLRLWDVSNPSSPAHIETLAPTGFPNPTNLGISLDPGDSSLVYRVQAGAGLSVVRYTATATTKLNEVSRIVESFSASGIAIRDDLVFVAGSRVLNSVSSYVLRITRNAVDPELVAEYVNTSFSLGAIALSANGQHVFAVAGTAGLKVFGVSNLSVAPTVQASLPLTGFASTITLAGNYLYIGIGSSGLKVVDIGNPLEPAVVGTGYNTPGAPKKTVVVGTTAYVADNTSLQVLDVSNPLAPTFLGQYSDAVVSFLDLAVLNNVAYVAGGGAGLRILDVSNPASIPLLAVVPSPASGTATNVAVAGNRACVSHGGNGTGFSIINITTPSSPVETQRLRIGMGPVIISGDYAIGGNATMYLGAAP